MREGYDQIDADTRRMIWRHQRAIVVLLVLVVLSLSMNIWAFMVITRARLFAREQAVKLAEQVEQSKSEVIVVEIPVQQTVPVRAAIPIQEDLLIPIDIVVPIEEQFDIPLETPFGLYSIPVPINATVPVSTTVPVRIQQTVEVSTTVDLDLTFPVRIPIGNTDLAGYLEKVRLELLRLGREL
ncbi:MAG: hypothetical protein KatS3mg057_2931 [Herpetosiphonaceae bacterium]|nr:MAG: hypothetical protein KatS3mg057_2931 [Herpetosiphonaceae bacterium]